MGARGEVKNGPQLESAFYFSRREFPNLPFTNTLWALGRFALGIRTPTNYQCMEIMARVSVSDNLY
jgi:hypothetical protein